MLDKVFNPRARVKLLLVARRTGLARGWHLVERVATLRLARWGVHVHRTALLQGEVTLPHPTGIVIGAESVIEDGVLLYQNVTLGRISVDDGDRAGSPTIRRGARLYAGCVILGPVEIGEGAIVAANAVVLHDVAPGDIVGGVPARPLGRDRPA